jgi:Tol biopolymer transport system component
VVLLPTGAGEAKTLSTGPLTVDAAKWLPDGKRLVLVAREAGHDPRLFLQDAAGGTPRPFTPEGIQSALLHSLPVSPDGTLVAAAGPSGAIALYPVDGGQTREVPGLEASDAVLGWTPDRRGLFVTQRRWPLTKIERVDLATGRRNPWKELAVADPIGIVASHLNLSADGRSYAWTLSRGFSNLYLVEGLR